MDPEERLRNIQLQLQELNGIMGDIKRYLWKIQFIYSQKNNFQPEEYEEEEK